MELEQHIDMTNEITSSKKEGMLTRTTIDPIALAATNGSIDPRSMNPD